jgi:anti-anti-sigma factor
MIAVPVAGQHSHASSSTATACWAPAPAHPRSRLLGVALLLAGVALIELGGELDLAAKPTLDEAIVTALVPGPVERLVVDFSHVTFADSTTVTWLLHADSRFQASGGQLIAVAGPGTSATCWR